ncbi:MAG: SseB family protein [Methanobrevibacter sp.]|uniref:SseB family protein n=1 Tax=Methanobrevibacter sp. TaxID=66852 RepID=UPI0026E0E22B|nr:SseB family protein [Methanobrevibacter sp.]MDO5849063.1 SseB family protein [Methanobrevibacter sp.]
MDGEGNSRLKELMERSPNSMDEKGQKEFLAELQKAVFFLPVDIDYEVLDFTAEDLGREPNPEEPISFAPIVATSTDGKSILPLFTDMEEADRFDYSNFISVGCDEIAALLIQTDDDMDVVINPTHENAVGMSRESFLDFVSANKIREIEGMILVNSRPLKEESRFYLREHTPLMRKLSEDGVFTSKLPFNASFRDNFTEDSPYLNILIVPKGVRYLYVGENGTYGDSIFPPVIRFRLVEEDGNVFTWKCISQDLNVPSGRNWKWIWVVMAVFIVIALIIIFIYCV